jgi:hypothetical protein
MISSTVFVIVWAMAWFDSLFSIESVLGESLETSLGVLGMAKLPTESMAT